MHLPYIFVVLMVASVYSAIGLLCNDLNTNACQLLAETNPDMCNETSVAQTTCPRFCKMCDLKCYHCNETSMNIADCNTTKACNDGDLCMLKLVKSTVDSHHDYIMTCAPQTYCDGNALTIPFGKKRDLHSRDVAIRCCDTDLCNHPTTGPHLHTTNPHPHTTSPHAHPHPHTTSPHPHPHPHTTKLTTHITHSTCLKDVILVVDESNPIANHQHKILNFLANLVGGLSVGVRGTHVSLGTFTSTGYKIRFFLDQYHTKVALQNAIKNIHLHGSPSNVLQGIRYVLQAATTSSAGDRPHVPDTVVIITEDTTAAHLARYAQALHHRVSDVIAIGIGGQVSRHDLQEIATNLKHTIVVRDPDNLHLHHSQLVNLICH